MPKLTESEEKAIALVAQKTQVHDDAVERFYLNINSEAIFPENRIIGLFVEVVALLEAKNQRLLGTIETLRDDPTMGWINVKSLCENTARQELPS